MSVILRRKIWEWNAGWMGLGVAYAGVYAATEGLKVAFGKPRPDLISRCNPDISDIASHTIGGLGINMRGAPTLVSWSICQNNDVREGFVSFPSGHASCMYMYTYLYEQFYTLILFADSSYLQLLLPA